MGIWSSCRILTKVAGVYRQHVLPFGSIASVTAFLRCSLAIWHIGSTLLHFCWSSYFDEYLSVCNQAETKPLDVCTSLLFQLLGWKLSDEKLVPYGICCKVLGIELLLTHSPSGHFSLANTDARKRRVDIIPERDLRAGDLRQTHRINSSDADSGMSCGT